MNLTIRDNRNNNLEFHDNVISGKSKRDLIRILDALLCVLIEEGEVSKTKLANRANLNPLSFQKYVSWLESMGAAIVRRVGERTTYIATPRAHILHATLHLLHHMLHPNTNVRKRYFDYLSLVIDALQEAGFKPKIGYSNMTNNILVCYDIIAQGNCNLGILIAPRNDPLNMFRLLTILYWKINVQQSSANKIDKLMLVTDDEPLLLEAAKLFEIPVARPERHSIIDVSRRMC
ncbi:hypothetical protein [Pyrolobus fumarii]|uniref:hypothetical protein n=1 Tax=Pyrolobus fumarii TaxID=54252 RepID=UPI00064F17A7|nr:hypothetical protein [Pyrolobus fumarii]